MVRSAALIIAAALAGPAFAQAPSLFPMDAKAEAKLQEVGVLLTFAAACVRHTTTAEDRMFKALADGESFTFRPGDEAYKEQIKSLLNDVYAKGLTNPKLRNLTARDCREMLSEKIEALNAGG
jgi:hypothetical protein